MERLRAAYGKPELEPHRAPVDELILTVLSQNTNDRNRDVAYGRLRERFGSWEEVRDAPTGGGRGGDPPWRPRADQVEGRSRTSCARSTATTWPGSRRRRVEEGRDYLCSLPGVGRKTAACVLLFSYGLPDVPGGHARLPRRHPARALPARARRSRRPTTRCCASPTRRTSSTSRSSATGAGPARRGTRPARSARSSRSARTAARGADRPRNDLLKPRLDFLRKELSSDG